MTTLAQPDTTPFDVFVARQPILDRRANLFGYELLFRSSHENGAMVADGERASLSVIANSFFVFGIETLTGRGRAFINFSRSTLLNDYAYVLPRERLVVEVLESVEPDDDVLAACKRLKAAGYVIALDDYDQREQHSPALLELADIVKIDFGACNRWKRASYARQLAPAGVTLLAEKVETQADYDDAVRFGYTYLQGYFFARPEVCVGRRTPGFRENRVEIIRELHKPDPDLRLVEDLVKHDPGLSFKLLRYLNSAAFSLRERVRSVGRAITFLGQSGMRTWATVIILADLGKDQPFETVVSSVIRARLCELIGHELQVGEQAQDLFLMGLFSLIDVLTGLPLETAIEDIPLVPAARDALLGADNDFRAILDLARAYERAEWDTATSLITRLGLTQDVVPSLYLEAVDWGNRISLMH